MFTYPRTYVKFAKNKSGSTRNPLLSLNLFPIRVIGP